LSVILLVFTTYFKLFISSSRSFWNHVFWKWQLETELV
jgi:hypothetical protein